MFYRIRANSMMPLFFVFQCIVRFSQSCPTVNRTAPLIVKIQARPHEGFLARIRQEYFLIELTFMPCLPELPLSNSHTSLSKRQFVMDHISSELYSGIEIIISFFRSIMYFKMLSRDGDHFFKPQNSKCWMVLSLSMQQMGYWLLSAYCHSTYDLYTKIIQLFW